MKNIQKDKKENAGEEKDNYFKFITTLAILLVIFVLSYFLIGIFYTKEIDFNKKDDETKDEVNVDNSTIMIGQIFEQPKEEYFVLIYDISDDKSSIKTWLPIYEGKEGALTVYKVDSSKKFNSAYIVKEGSNVNATSLSDLKVISPTLIKINDKKITEYIEGEEEISNKFKN